MLRRDRDDATVSQFLTTPKGVTLVDTSDMTLEETVGHVLDLVRAALPGPGARPQDPAESQEDHQRARALRAGLEDYELDEEDLALLSGDQEGPAEDAPEAGLPVLAVIGRPNVGKSTLVNRVIGLRAVVVQDTPRTSYAEYV